MLKARARRTRQLSKLQLVPGRAAMQAAGQLVADKTRERTRRGRDASGRAFTPYAATGKKAGQTVDLTESGQMLDDYGPRNVTDRSVGLGFATSRSEYLATVHTEGRGSMPVRDFLGVPPTWRKQVQSVLAQGVRRVLASLRLSR